jgi:hypothetical protein
MGSKEILLTSKILLPHDGTEISDKTLEKSKGFAKAFRIEYCIKKWNL